MTEDDDQGQPFGAFSIDAQHKILEVGMPSGSGRTDAMLEAAISAAGKSHTVVLVFHSHAFRLASLSRFRELAVAQLDPSDPEINERRGHMLVFRNTRYYFHSAADGEPHVYVGSLRFIDHHAVQLAIEQLCRATV